MLKGRLLASACALGLLVAAPAFAAGTDKNDTSATSMSNGNANGTSMPGAAANTGMNNPRPANAAANADNARSGMGNSNGRNSADAGSMDRTRSTNARDSMNNDKMNNDKMRQARQPMHAGRSHETDTSQNAAIDRLNDQSLQAAQGHHDMSSDNNGNRMGAAGSDHMQGNSGSPSGNGRM